MARDRRRLLPRRGSVPLALHGLLEYGLGVLLIASSSLFSFDSTATAVSIMFGALVLVITALSDLPTALVRRLPLDYHMAVDYVIGISLVASPFAFFNDDEAAFAFFVIIGIGYLVFTAVTRFKSTE